MLIGKKTVHHQQAIFPAHATVQPKKKNHRTTSANQKRLRASYVDTRSHDADSVLVDLTTHRSRSHLAGVDILSHQTHLSRPQHTSQHNVRQSTANHEGECEIISINRRHVMLTLILKYSAAFDDHNPICCHRHHHRPNRHNIEPEFNCQKKRI